MKISNQELSTEQIAQRLNVPVEEYEKLVLRDKAKRLGISEEVLKKRENTINIMQALIAKHPKTTDEKNFSFGDFEESE